MEKSLKYSQNDEEKIIVRCVGDIEAGTILDIGAGDGRTFSNSLALIEKGWKGILVEPSPFAFSKLLQLHGGNPNVTLLNAAIGVEDRIARFYESEDTLYSTTRANQANLWAGRGMKYREYWVPQVSISTMQNQLGACGHVVSIDTEGTSFDILGQCPIGPWDTRVIILEHDGRIVEISGWGRERGFRVHEVNAENVILFRE